MAGSDAWNVAAACSTAVASVWEAGVGEAVARGTGVVVGLGESLVGVGAGSVAVGVAGGSAVAVAAGSAVDVGGNADGTGLGGVGDDFIVNTDEHAVTVSASVTLSQRGARCRPATILSSIEKGRRHVRRLPSVDVRIATR